MKHFFIFCFLLLVLPAVSEAVYTPPLGIPKPDFGVEEVAPGDPPSWSATPQSATPLYYYVCPSCPGATDTANPNGYPAKPRLSIPIPFTGGGAALPAGSRVVLSGTFGQGYQGNRYIRCDGNAANPCFIGGRSASDRAHFVWSSDIGGSALQLTGSYTIYEYIFNDCNANPTFSNCGAIALGPFSATTPVDHVVLRHSEMYGETNNNGPSNHRNGSAVYGSGPTNKATNVVYWHNHIHHTGVPSIIYSPDCSIAGKVPDSHGINVTAWVDHLWILENEFDHNSGDGVQINNDWKSTHTLDAIRFVFLGKNESHHNRQYGMGSKLSMDTIFSQNHIHDQFDDCYTGGGIFNMYGAVRQWMIFNTIHDSLGIFRNSEDGTDWNLDTYPVQPNDYYWIGNVGYNERLSPGWTLNVGPDTTPTNSSARVVLLSFAGNHPITRHFINNTFYNFQGGLYTAQVYGALDFKNNIFWGGPQGQWWFMQQRTEDTQTAPPANKLFPFFSQSSWDYNLFPSTVTSNLTKMMWGRPGLSGITTSFDNPTDFHAGSYVASNPSALYSPSSANHQGANDRMADPTFVNAGAADFRLQSGSPAIGAGDNASIQAAITAFDALYGPSGTSGTTGASINTDMNGNARIQDGRVELGAYEFGTATAPTLSIAITSQAQVSSATYTLTGTCTGCASPPTITLANVSIGSATGTTNWSKSGITLLPGNNLLVATGTDASSNTATASKVVKYTGVCGP
jgi:hypothetical protein